MRFKTFAAVAALAVGTTFAASTTFAATINYSGSEPSLDELFGNAPPAGLGLVSYNTPAKVDAAQMHNDQYWSVLGGAGGSIATLIFEIAGNAGSTNFGVFDKANAANRVQLWGGSAVQGDQVVMSILADGSVRVNFVDTGVDFADNAFGYYIEIGSTIFYSDEALNALGADQMAAFRGNDSDTIQIPGYAAGTFGSNEYLLAWEDILVPFSDSDYNDLVVGVESVRTVAEPGTLAVLGLGLLGLGMIRRRAAKA